MSPRHWRWIEVALFLTAALVATGPGVLPGRTIVPFDILGLFQPWTGIIPQPVNPLVGDPVLEIADRQFVLGAWRGGHLPLWNPQVLAGHPAAGDSKMGGFNPLQVLPSLAFGLLNGFAAQVVLQFWLAGMFMSLWVREVTGSRFGGFVGGLTFMLAGYNQVWLAYPYMLGTLLWLPAIASTWERAATGRDTTRMIGAGGAAAGMALLAGQLQFAVIGAGALGIYIAARLATEPDLRSAHRRRRAAASAIAIAALGASCGAVTVLPAAALVGDAGRPALDWTALRTTAVPLSRLETLISPWRAGGPGHGEYQGPLNYSELALYAGAVPLLLTMLVGFAKPRRLGVLAGGSAAAVLLVVVGSPLAQPLAEVPLINSMGLLRWLGLWPFAIGFASGVAVGTIPRRLGPNPLRALSALSAAGVALAAPDWLAMATVAVSAIAVAAWMRSPRSVVVRGFLTAVLAADLLGFGWGYTPSAPNEWAFPPVAPVAGLAAEARTEEFRIAPVQDNSIVLGPDVSAAIGLADIGGYSSVVRQPYRAFIQALAEPPGNGYIAQNANVVAIGRPGRHLLRIMNVRYVLGSEELRPILVPAAATEPCLSRRPLSAGDSIATVVTPLVDGLNRLDIDALGDAVLALAVADEHGQDLVTAAAQPAPDGRREVYFAPIADSAGRDFVVTVTAPPDGDSGSEICIDEGGLHIGAWAEEPAPPLIEEANGVFVHGNPLSLGRAWFVSRAEFVTSQPEALARLADPQLDPSEVVVIESTGPPPQAGDVVTAAGVDEAAVRLSSDGPNRIQGIVEAPVPGWVVLSEAHAPGWSATLNGQPVPVARAFGGLRAVPISAGRHDLMMNYVAPGFRAGAALTGLGASVAVALLVLATPRSRRRGSP